MTAKKKNTPFWNVCVTDFFASKTCAGMTGLQQGAYLLALARCWDWDGLPADPKKFRKVLDLDRKWFSRYGGQVMAAFVPDETMSSEGSLSDDTKLLRHPRQEEQRRELDTFHRVKAEAGRKGGIASAKQRASSATANVQPPSPSPSPSPSLEPKPPDDGLGIPAEFGRGGEGVFFDGGEDPEAWRWLEHLAGQQERIKDPLGYVITMRRKGRHPRDLGLPWWREPGTPEPDLTRSEICRRLKAYRGKHVTGGVIGWRQEWGKWVIDNGVADIPLDQYDEINLLRMLQECEGTLEEAGGEKRKEVMPTQDEK